MSKSSEFIIIVLIILLTITCTLLYTNKCDCNCSVKQTSNDVDTLRRFEQNENTSQISIPQLNFKEENLSIDYNSKDSLSSSSNIPLDKQLDMIDIELAQRDIILPGYELEQNVSKSYLYIFMLYTYNY